MTVEVLLDTMRGIDEEKIAICFPNCDPIYIWDKAWEEYQNEEVDHFDIFYGNCNIWIKV